MNTMLNRLFIGYYFEMKRRNGYSEIEIAQAWIASDGTQPTAC